MVSSANVKALIELSENLLQAGASQQWDNMAELDQQRRRILNQIATREERVEEKPAQADINRLLQLDRKVIQLVQTHAEQARADFLDNRQKNTVVSQYQTISAG